MLAVFFLSSTSAKASLALIMFITPVTYTGGVLSMSTSPFSPDCNLCDASRHEKTILTFRLPMEAFISDDSHTQALLYNTGWMTDGDRSCEVEVRQEQESTKG